MKTIPHGMVLTIGIVDRILGGELRADIADYELSLEDALWTRFEAELKKAWRTAVSFWLDLPPEPHVTKGDALLTAEAFTGAMEGWEKRGVMADMNRAILNMYAIGLHSIASQVNRADNGYGEDIEDYIKDDGVYKVPKIGISVSFDQQHREALQWLSKDAAFWLTSADQQEKLWGDPIGKGITKIVAKGMEDGLGRKEVGSLLKSAFPDLMEPIKGYFDVVSSAALVRSRTFGTVQGLLDGGAASYRWVASLDERTCPTCGGLNGTVFDVSFASEQMSGIMGASSPDDVKAISPWVTFDEIDGKSSEELQALGVGLPPVHGRCRCTISVDKWT